MFKSANEIYNWAWCRDIGFQQVYDMGEADGIVVNRDDWVKYCVEADEGEWPESAMYVGSQGEY